MKRRIQDSPGSYTITLPREIANDLGLKRGDRMDFILEENKTIRMGACGFHQEFHTGDQRTLCCGQRWHA